MLKIQEIEEKLMKINGAVFQDLCDTYIFNTEPSCNNIHREGSQRGKQKTVKGTPDSYYILPSGKYVLLEYTTQSPVPKQKFLDKIKSDIDKCTNHSITHLKLADIEKITYCINSDLTLTEHKELVDYSFEKGIRLDIKSLSTLAIGLLSKASPLAKEFLGIAIDSGQILEPAAFIKSYQRSGYSTPLSNQFIGRTDELTRLRDTVLSSPVTILTGAPGVGKTKLALGLFDLAKELPYQMFCIDNKHVPIYDDLKTFLPANENFLILIDDANRQLTNLKPILSLLKEERSGKIHIIITVRDYALEEIEQFAQPYSPVVIRLEKFTDEQLTALIASSDFEIHNYRYVKRILEIADGNARLAIMAAKVALEKQNLDALQDVTDLYDAYFGMAISPDVFSNQLHLKTIGILSFFHSLSKEDVKLHTSILEHFAVDRHQFEQSLIELENLEMVESSSDLLTYRISDQVLGTYFFYYTFFKKPVLDFNVILRNYFISHYSRVRDTVIPANNTFGYLNVFNKIDPHLISFWKEIADDEDTALKFLGIFWLYKQDEALHFVNNKILSLPLVIDPVLLYDEDKVNRDYSDNDRYLSLLLNFFYHPLENLKDAFALSIRYVLKKPECYGQLIKILKEGILYNREDEAQGFYRQHEFINFIAAENAEIPLSTRFRIFYDVVPALMKTSFNIVTGARKLHSMAFYRYDLPLTDDVKELRKIIWFLLKQWFSANPKAAVIFLHDYLQRTPDRVKDIFTFDRPFVIDIFKTHFTFSSFIHCYIVQEFVTWFKRVKIEGDDYDELKKVYTNEAYQSYLALSDNYARGKSADDTQLTHEEFQAYKEKEIRKKFVLKGTQAFINFYQVYTEIHETLVLFKNNYHLQFSLDIVMDETYVKTNKNLGHYEYVAKTGNSTDYIAYRVFGELVNDIDLYRSFLALLTPLSFKAKDCWLMNWFVWLPEEQVTTHDAAAFLAMLETSTDIHYLQYRQLVKFQKANHSFNRQLLEIVYNKNAGASRIKFYDLFDTHLEEFVNDWDLVKKTYLQQQLKQESFDHNYKIFFSILLKDPGFLNEYISSWSGHYFSVREHEGISITWNHPDANLIMEQAMDLLCEAKHYSIRQDICNVLFKKMPPDKKTTALEFLQHYLLKNNVNEDKVDSTFDCVRHNFPESLELTLLSFLETQPSFDIFSKIKWTTSYMMGNGSTSFGEVRANQYKTILNILEKITEKTYRFADHKLFIKERILSENRYAAHERKRQFIEQDW